MSRTNSVASGVQLGARRAAQRGAQQGLLERAAIVIEREAQRRRHHAEQPQQLPRPARELAQHQRKQRVAMGDGAVEIEDGDGHARRCYRTARCHDSPQLRRANGHFASGHSAHCNSDRGERDAERFRFIPPLLGKALVIGVLIVLLLVPIAQVESLVGERVGMRQTAAMRVAESWGGAQTTAGVLLAIPVETTRVVIEQTAAGRETQRTEVERNVLYVLPDTLKVERQRRP